MKWRRGTSTADVIDTRGAGGGRRGGAALPVGGGLGVLGVILFLAIQLLGGGSGAAFDVPAGFDETTQAPNAQPIPPGQDPDADLKDFSTYVFNNAQGCGAHVRRAGATYDRAKLQLYTGGVTRAVVVRRARPSGPSTARPISASTGPVLLPRHGAPAGGRGRLRLGVRDRPRARAHIQNLQGTSDRSSNSAARTRAAPTTLSVRLELQADCYAGVWARSVMRTTWRRATSRRRSRRRRRSATTGCSAGPAGASTRTPSRTAPRPSGAPGSTVAAQRGEPADCDTFSTDQIYPRAVCPGAPRPRRAFRCARRDAARAESPHRRCPRRSRRRRSTGPAGRVARRGRGAR